MLQNNAMKKLFFISLSAALLWVGSAATFAQVDRSDPEALIKTATQLILSEARQGAIRQGDTQSVISLMDRDVLPYVDFLRTTELATGAFLAKRFARSAGSTGQAVQDIVDSYLFRHLRTDHA